MFFPSIYFSASICFFAPANILVPLFFLTSYSVHPTLLRLPLLALPIVQSRQGFSLEVCSSERQVQVVFVTSLDVSLNSFQSKLSNSRFPKVKPLIELFFALSRTNRSILHGTDRSKLAEFWTEPGREMGRRGKLGETG